MRGPRQYYIYIMSNGPRSHVLYTGVTGNLPRRVFEHKNKLLKGFTCRYNLTRLVYYESFALPTLAIDREKEVKGWRRSKKIGLIQSMNPHWHDLAQDWTEHYNPCIGCTPDPSPGWRKRRIFGMTVVGGWVASRTEGTLFRERFPRPRSGAD